MRRLTEAAMDRLISEWRDKPEARLEELVRSVEAAHDTITSELLGVVRELLREQGGPRWPAARDRARNLVKNYGFDAPTNPYAGNGSMEEAWLRGYEGRPMLAAPGSDYARAFEDGKTARIGNKL
jgi:hypothetical protein